MVFTLNSNKKNPLDIINEAQSRQLLKSHKAIIHLYYPFTIRIKDRQQEQFLSFKEYHLKIDPGSKVTGLSILERNTNNVVWLAELEHKKGVKDSIQEKSRYRRRRRTNLRYRQPRFLNRKPQGLMLTTEGLDVITQKCKHITSDQLSTLSNLTNKKYSKNKIKEILLSQNSKDFNLSFWRKFIKPHLLEVGKAGWLPPSLKSRADQVIHWIEKLKKLCKITKISFENVKFDTHLMLKGNLNNEEYQQGELQDYEIWEYLLEKFDRKCVYCGRSSDILNRDHIVPRSKGGTNRAGNLVLSCRECNERKGNMSLQEFVKDSNKLKQIQSKIGKSINLSDAAWLNAVRNYIFEYLQKMNNGIEISFGSGAMTKMHRIKYSIPKEHYYDALCVGEDTPENFNFLTNKVFIIKAEGRGQYRRTNVCGGDSYFLVTKEAIDDFKTKKEIYKLSINNITFLETLKDKKFKGGLTIARKNRGSELREVLTKQGFNKWKIQRVLDKIEVKETTVISDKKILAKRRINNKGEIVQFNCPGSPRQYMIRKKNFYGFYGNDMVELKNKIGRLNVRATGGFNLKDKFLDDKGKEKVVTGSYKICKLIQRFNGYTYREKEREKIEIYIGIKLKGRKSKVNIEEIIKFKKENNFLRGEQLMLI